MEEETINLDEESMLFAKIRDTYENITDLVDNMSNEITFQLGVAAEEYKGTIYASLQKWELIRILLNRFVLDNTKDNTCSLCIGVGARDTQECSGCPIEERDINCNYDESTYMAFRKAYKELYEKVWDMINLLNSLHKKRHEPYEENED